MTYLLARPALRRFLHDPTPTKYETQLISRLKTHAGAKAGSLQTVETIFAAMFVDDADARAHTFDQLWALQQHDGPFSGGWQWFGQPNLDPWETPAQNTYGSAFAALAIGAAPEQLRASADSQTRIKALAEYLQNESQISPMHGRLMTLWASTKLPEVMTPAVRQATIDELLRKQRPEGGWSLETLGPWASHPAAPKSLDVKRSDSYATAFTAYVLKVAGGKGASKQTDRALDWLRKHQDHETGAWPAVSLNKVYPAGSMEESFLQDAATAFAVLALIS